MYFPTTEQWLSIGRHTTGFVGGAVAMFGALHFISADDAGKATTALTQISTGVSSIIAGMGTLMTLAAAAYGFLTAGPLSMFFKGAKAVASDPVTAKPATIAQQATIATATQELPQVQTVVASRPVSSASPSSSVVSITDVAIIKK